MSKIAYHILKPQLKITQQIFLKFYGGKVPLLSFYQEKGYLIVGRYGTNKTTLRKILKKVIE